MNLNSKNISPQIIYLLNPHPHPHHIRYKESRYLYMNLAMRELLNLPTGIIIEGKRLSEIKPDGTEFFEGLHQQEERVIQRQTSVFLLITAHFGKEPRLQPTIVDIHPFFDETGQLMGSLAEVRECQFFSPLDYIQGKSPKTLKTSFPNTMLTQRELDIIFYFSQGFSQKEVAEYLHLSRRALDNKLMEIYEKMEVHHQEEFKKYIEERGLNRCIPLHLLALDIRVIG